MVVSEPYDVRIEHETDSGRACIVDRVDDVRAYQIFIVTLDKITKFEW